MTRTKLAAMALVVGLAIPFAAAAEDPPPGTFKIPYTDTTARFYGYVQLDTMWDVSGRHDPNCDWAGCAATIPIIGSSAAARKPQLYWTMHQSRVGFTTSTPTKIPLIGVIGTKVEADFNVGGNFPSPATNSNVFRMRHAYGTLGSWLLVGQTWGTFTDLGSYPDTVDFNPPANNPLIGQPQVRLTLPAGPGTLMVSVENPASSAVGLGGASAGAFESVPDFVVRYDVTHPYGHVSARVVTLNYKNTAHANQGIGGAVSGSFKVLGDSLVAAVQGGHGIGRYTFGALTSGQDAFSTSSDILLWDEIGYHIGYTHVWSPQFRSNLVWSQTFFGGDSAFLSAAGAAGSKAAVLDSGGDVITPASTVSPGSFTHRIDQGFVNTFWTVTKSFELGLEYTYGRRYTFDGKAGMENRINASAHFNIF